MTQRRIGIGSAVAFALVLAAFWVQVQLLPRTLGHWTCIQPGGCATRAPAAPPGTGPTLIGVDAFGIREQGAQLEGHLHLVQRDQPAAYQSLLDLFGPGSRAALWQWTPAGYPLLIQRETWLAEESAATAVGIVLIGASLGVAGARARAPGN